MSGRRTEASRSRDYPLAPSPRAVVCRRLTSHEGVVPAIGRCDTSRRRRPPRNGRAARSCSFTPFRSTPGCGTAARAGGEAGAYRAALSRLRRRHRRSAGGHGRRLRRRRHRSARRAAHPRSGHRRPVDGRLRGVRDVPPRAALLRRARPGRHASRQADTPEGVEGRKRMLQLVGRKGRRRSPTRCCRSCSARRRGARGRTSSTACGRSCCRTPPRRSPAPSAR